MIAEILKQTGNFNVEHVQLFETKEVGGNAKRHIF
jgi:hypothetical protein